MPRPNEIGVKSVLDVVSIWRHFRGDLNEGNAALRRLSDNVGTVVRRAEDKECGTPHGPVEATHAVELDALRRANAFEAVKAKVPIPCLGGTRQS